MFVGLSVPLVHCLMSLLPTPTLGLWFHPELGVWIGSPDLCLFGLAPLPTAPRRRSGRVPKVRMNWDLIILTLAR